MMMWTSFLLTLVLAISGQVAASDNATDAAVFVFNSSSTDQAFIFAVNAVKSSGDLYFHLEAPSGQAWTAVGIGSEMKDALIFAAYASKNGTGVTVSPRIATRHAEPSYDKNINLELVWPSWSNDSNTIGTDGILRADAVCRNCTSWLSGQGQLDLTSKSVPFIFAMGPAQTMHSSSLSASMRRHSYYGHFNMDMTAATSPDRGSVPSPNGNSSTYRLQYASAVKDMTAEDSIAPAAHALIMIAAFVFVFPFGSLVLRILHKALWHGAVQILGLLMVVVGFGLGIYLSTEYNKVSNSRIGAPIHIPTNTFIQPVEAFRLSPPAHRPPDPDLTPRPTRPRPTPPPHLEADQISNQILEDTQIPRPCNRASRLDQWRHRLQFRRQLVVPWQVHCHSLGRSYRIFRSQRHSLVVDVEKETAKAEPAAAMGR